MESDSDIGGVFVAVLAMLYYFFPVWGLDEKSEDKGKSKDEEKPKSKSLADHLYRWFLFISLTVIGFIVVMCITLGNS